MITIHQRHRRTDGRTDGQTDRQTTRDRNTALCTKVHRAVKIDLKFSSVCEKCQKTAGCRGRFFLTHTVDSWSAMRQHNRHWCTRQKISYLRTHTHTDSNIHYNTSNETALVIQTATYRQRSADQIHVMVTYVDKQRATTHSSDYSVSQQQTKQ